MVGPATVLSHKCDILVVDDQIVRDNRLPAHCRHLASRRHRTVIPVATPISLPPRLLTPCSNVPKLRALQSHPKLAPPPCMNEHTQDRAIDPHSFATLSQKKLSVCVTPPAQETPGEDLQATHKGEGGGYKMQVVGLEQEASYSAVVLRFQWRRYSRNHRALPPHRPSTSVKTAKMPKSAFREC